MRVLKIQTNIKNEVIFQPLTFTAPVSELSDELSLLLSLLLSESDPELLLLSLVCDG